MVDYEYSLLYKSIVSAYIYIWCHMKENVNVQPKYVGYKHYLPQLCWIFYPCLLNLSYMCQESEFADTQATNLS